MLIQLTSSVCFSLCNAELKLNRRQYANLILTRVLETERVL